MAPSVDIPCGNALLLSTPGNITVLMHVSSSYNECDFHPASISQHSSCRVRLGGQKASSTCGWMARSPHRSASSTPASSTILRAQSWYACHASLRLRSCTFCLMPCSTLEFWHSQSICLCALLRLPAPALVCPIMWLLQDACWSVCLPCSCRA